MVTPLQLNTIREIVGAENVLNAPEDLLVYSYDGTATLGRRPEAVVIPRSVEQIAKIMILANQEGFSVVPRGSGSGLSGGSIPVENCIVLLMAHWNRIIELDEANLAAWVEPGVITAQLDAAANERGLFYPPDPGSREISTLGGNVAENAGGLRGLKYGVTKNYVLGLEAVLPTGEVVRAGGKAIKDVAGYDLKDIFVGSEGTLGIFTKILLRLLPRPEASSTVSAAFDSIASAAKAVSAIVAGRITPSMMEFLDGTTMRCVEEYAAPGLPRTAGALLIMEVDGRKAIVEEDAQRIVEYCRRHGAVQAVRAADESESLKLKAARRAAFPALARVRPTTILEDVTVPRSALAEAVTKIEEIARRKGVLLGNFGHAGDGNLHPTCLTDERNREELGRAERALEEIFDLAVALGGTITGEHGTGLAKRPFLEKQVGRPAIDVMHKLKDVMDPNGVLNPGKVLLPRVRCEGKLPGRREEIAGHDAGR
ncbi:MAG: glycolate oxidase subunit GlcD [Planctomycetes bacterium RBG_16_59_8]|nr:MAG: glycolate oxidase subunit GlcD [Planctomycetes bacterium RBG_16_59_8]